MLLRDVWNGGRILAPSGAVGTVTDRWKVRRRRWVAVEFDDHGKVAVLPDEVAPAA